jgi:hypothetical protein
VKFSDRVSASKAAPSLTVPNGMSKSEFAMREAIKGFERARRCKTLGDVAIERRDAITNLAHAWLNAVLEPSDLRPDRALELYRELVEAAGVR